VEKRILQPHNSAMNINIELYGRLKQTFGADTLNWETNANTPRDIYLELCEHFKTVDESATLRPIIDDTFCHWQDPVSSNNVLGFLPPASGG
jgi:molybdopterin converting factor small subunit